MSKQTNRILFTFMLLLLIVVAFSYGQDANLPENGRDARPQTESKEAKLKVDGERIKSYIEWMSRDEMQGRKSLTEGFIKAEEWAAENFESWGLKPAGQNGTYFQDVPIERGFTYMTGIPELKIGNRTFLMEEGDFTLHPSSTAATSVDAEVIFVGYGISAPEKGLDEYAGVEVEGKVVLAFQGSPRDAAAPRMRFGPALSEEDVPTEAWAEESTDHTKIQTAFDKGAAAILLYEQAPAPSPAAGRAGRVLQRPAQRQAQRPTRGRGRDEPELEFDRNFLAFTIDSRVFRTIMKPDQQESVAGFGRRINTIQWDIRKKMARSTVTGITAQLKGYDNVEEYSEELENNISRNVIAKIEGTDPDLKRQYVIMGGHMDHLGIRNGLVYNGADDNASGTAVVMEIARVLSEAGYKPKRTLIFCCWCAEELGLIGSNYYTSNPCDGVTMDQVVTYFNMDMVGLGDTIGAPGALNFPSIWEVIKKNQDEDVISAVEPETGGPGGSDYSGFITKGIEALGLMTSGGGGHPDYHQPEDDAHKMDSEILRKTGQFVLQGTINLANETRTNLLIEDRQVLYDAMRLAVENINPDLEGSSWRCMDIDGYSQDKLRWRIASVEEKPQKSLEVGIMNMQIFEGDVQFLMTASDALGFGRVDIKGNDGVWVAEGRLTEHGRYALGMFEENRIVVNLVCPCPQLLRDVLAAATRPFIVTGFYILDPQTYDQINKKKVLLGVKFDPQDVEGCVERLDKAKTALGDSDNLVLFVTSTNGLENAKKDLYVSLIKKGWKAEEIGGERRGRRGRGGGAGITGGNLGVLRFPR